MTSFASLMALSATHTKESQRVVESALQERRRKEVQQKKQQEEREAKEKEQERKRLLKRFEDQKREQERLQRLDVERQAKQLAQQRREEEQRDTLRYGPKKAAKLAGKHSSNGSGDSPNWPSSSSSNREAVRKLRVPDDQDDEPSGPALTREEIRERKLKAELRRTYTTAKRSTATGSYSKHGKKLPGGVLDIKTSGATADVASGQSVKERLTSLPMTLKVLGGKNKDRRSELEMFYDSKKKRSGQVLEGDEARNFDGYFGPTKKQQEKLKQVVSTSATTSGADSPGPPERSSSSAPTSLKEASSLKPSPAPAAASKHSSAYPRGTSKQAVSSTPSTSKTTIPKIGKANTTTQRPSSSTAHSRPKRPRSPSPSESPPPKRRHMESDISSTIWKMFGKDRQQYTSRDVFSDDEDMEADAVLLEREEAYSARIAKKEELLAMQEEARHEQEKRRRKKERER
ncbi:hypothetical protein BYT27DRAFT_7012816, partial [Phlegmacium glaucopus]